MTGPIEVTGRDKMVAKPPLVGAGGVTENPGGVSSEAAAAAGSGDNVAEMMGRLRLTAAEAVAVVLDDDKDDVQVHSPWAIVGKVLSLSILHINTIAAALRPAWGNPRGLVFNSAGDNLFVAEFGTKGDMDRVVHGPPWVVGKRAVLLQDFNVDLKPKDMIFNVLDAIPVKVTDEMNADLCKPYNDERIELLADRFQQGFGHDGFPSLFYQTHWDFFKKEICDAVRAFWEGTFLRVV
ncbi:hypothetical protein QYE76_024028 [Lolium multiflorum]|uniref:DUF4283 domain-containing protein n=1 Tax=Lolium multiflorum TaxID=4521 RepID=A0AAD8RCX1_LOLMU|nr:hypothetical protein QYE76_024028 [Lolium multiflorum]